ncbi:transforming growth factor-beta-induced protein [Plakobranchus ocellatus]|uniref:Transforming growth factor-beta-induced protein n=1 Tax=Plakobranchus ocellatus TaxID=259542 RepID=A0AAV4A986_9GAST|nr:transforming growth factor-beta-induced protein [Plakobranchus ocellatus]
MAMKMLLVAVVAIAMLASMVASVNLRESYGSNEESHDFDQGQVSRSHNWNRHSVNNLFNLLFNVHTGGMRPWWEGPNVCQSEKIEEKNTTDTSGEEGEGVELSRHFSTRFQICDESESVYKCTITQHDQDGHRKMVILYECCKGYERQKGDDGCPRQVELRDLLTLADELGLSDFLKAVSGAGLEQELMSREVTVFAPVNGGFGGASDFDVMGPSIVLQRDAPYTITEVDGSESRVQERIQSGLMSHVISGARRSSSFHDEEIIETGAFEATGIRVNFFYTPKQKLMTANCVPVVSRDNRGSNGVIHTVERLLPTVTESLMDMVKSRPDLSTLKTVLATARYVPKLEEDGQGTLLAPSNDAFARMNPRLRGRLLAGDKKCLQKVVDNHILPHTICSSVIQGKARTLNSLGHYLNISRSEDDKVFVHGAQVTQRDIMATNGVMHVIDEVIVPKEALDFVDVLEKEGFTELLNLVEAAGLTKTLEMAENVTVFAPTNAAIQKLPENLRSRLIQDRELLREVLFYHVSPNADERRHLYKGQSLPTLTEGSNIRIDTYSLHPFHHYGVLTAQCAPLTGTRMEACNGRVRAIQDVMIPPRGNVVDVLSLDKKFSILVSLVKRAGLADALQEEGPFTVFAPNNRAFEQLGQEVLEDLDQDVEKLKTVLKRHVIQDNLCCAGIFRRHSWFGHSRVRTLSGHRLRVSRDYSNTPRVERASITTCDSTATNGNVLEIDSVLLDRRPFGYHRSRWNRRRYWEP